MKGGAFFRLHTIIKNNTILDEDLPAAGRPGQLYGCCLYSGDLRRDRMFFLRKALMIGAIIFFSAFEVHASEVLLKIACVETKALNAFRVPRTLFSSDELSVDYSALAAAVTHTVSGKPGVNGSRPLQAVLHDVPAGLQARYPEQGRVIGRQQPGGSSGWQKYVIDFSNAPVVFLEFSVARAVLDSLAAASTVAGLRERPILQYTHGSTQQGDAVFTAGYSFFAQQLAQANARGWLRDIMSVRNGIGLVALRRADFETRTDTLIIEIDQRGLPHNGSGRQEIFIVLGWDPLH
jgi:hypothetical protein